MDGNSSHVCPAVLLDGFRGHMDKKLLGVNCLMMFNSVLMGFVVSVGVLAPRTRRNPRIALLLLGASTLFLPIVSNVAATIGNDMYVTRYLNNDTKVIAANCEPAMHHFLILIWTSVVITIGINTSEVVVADAREGRTIQPPTELLIKALWVAYLIMTFITPRNFFSATRTTIGDPLGNGKALSIQFAINLGVAALLPYFRMFEKYVMFYSTQRSVTLCRNPKLIVAHMDKQLNAVAKKKKQLNELVMENQIHGQVRESGDTDLPPKLIVCGEALYYKVMEQPGGFKLVTRSEMTLVTLDTVWQLPDDDIFPNRAHKDLCFSFALFKLLRCRFAKYTFSKAGFMQVQSFFRKNYLNDNNQYDRVFEVIANELSFVDHYYYNTCRSIGWMRVALFLVSLINCLSILVFISSALNPFRGNQQQVFCSVWCPGQQTTEQHPYRSGKHLGFGNAYFDVVPVYLVTVVLLLSEVRDIVYHFCSNKTKVELICRCLPPAASPTMKKCIAFVINCCGIKLVNSWGDKIDQCSILVHCPWWKPYWLFGFPKEKSTKELSALKKSVFEALRKKNLTVDHGGVKHIRQPSPPVPVTVDRSLSETILDWHIATSLFELKDQEQPADPERITENAASEQSLDSDSKKMTAMQLSRYCAYLVACRPELLPDEDEWCKELYADVLEHADDILRKAGAGAGFHRLVEFFEPSRLDELRGSRGCSGKQVIKRGGELARQLVALNLGWKDLANFWSDMILYIAPSENLDGHAQAISRGGEMVTLLWALLAHDGIVDRHVDAAADTDTVSAPAAAGRDFNIQPRQRSQESHGMSGPTRPPRVNSI